MMSNSNVQASPNGFGRTLVRFVVKGLFVAAFCTAAYFAVVIWQDGQWAMASLFATVTSMTIPFVDTKDTLRERISFSCTVPFAFLGLFGAVGLYFKLFRLELFNEIFNDKGTGPSGLVLFAVMGLLAGGYLGNRIVKWSIQKLSSQGIQ